MKRALIGLLALAACSPSKPDETPAAPVPPTASAAPPAAPVAAAPKLKPATAADIRLVRGYYVEGDTKCAEASNATLYLLRRDAMGESHEVCTWKKIEAESDLRFHVSQQCDGDSGGAPFDVIYDMKSPRDFELTYKGGGTSKFHYCEQAELPDPWSDNDIRDLIK